MDTIESLPLQKLYMKDMTRQKLYHLFGLEEVSNIQELDDWLATEEPLTEEEKNITKFYQKRLLKNISDWNEQELSLGFIGPIINIIDFKVRYKMNFFAQRLITSVIDNYELIGRPDGMVAKGGSEPETPYFNFHEYKRDIDSSGDPAGQNLAAMFAGQQLNQDGELIYGCYVVGRHWYFMALKGRKFAISKDFSTTDKEIFTIVKHLKSLRQILFERLGY